ncbi:hypothetical protein LLE49_23115 [Alicyclobacillus tolerans]|uniref:hypothetical protein n=1 Tax=Alicyclobacillus tolerans TaxID=90970 RepID=UPI001F1786CD|nr:hypothetical protein [Alicyclobacillus tolerans]MCF8567614.1 hypothetical protein [Alicyclobacillus tolerans]
MRVVSNACLRPSSTMAGVAVSVYAVTVYTDVTKRASTSVSVAINIGITANGRVR